MEKLDNISEMESFLQNLGSRHMSYGVKMTQLEVVFAGEAKSKVESKSKLYDYWGSTYKSSNVKQMLLGHGANPY